MCLLCNGFLLLQVYDLGAEALTRITKYQEEHKGVSGSAWSLITRR